MLDRRNARQLDLDPFNPLVPYPDLFLDHENLCRSTWCISEKEDSVLLFRKAATISEGSSMCDNLLDSTTDVTTPQPFQEQGSVTQCPYPEEDSPEMYTDRETPPRPFAENEIAMMDPERLATVRRQSLIDYPLSQLRETLSPANFRHIVVPASLELPLQNGHLENDNIFTFHLKPRTSPFSKAISYLGGPQFSGSSEDEEFVNQIDHTNAVIHWLDSQHTHWMRRRRVS